jgi:hypothetical protein
MIINFFKIFIKISILLITTNLTLKLHAQIYQLSGKVIDKKTKESLAFVSISYNNKQEGTFSDIDGKFTITAIEPIHKLKLTYVGYKTKEFSITEIKEKITIELEQTDFTLNEVVILPGENPAHAIIKKVQKNKEKNAPQSLPEYKYNSYSKLIITAIPDSLKNQNVNDTSYSKAKKFLDKQHLFLIEQVTEKKYKKPDKETETILAARVSGLQNPSFLSLFTQLMSFGFYQDIISISDKDYINPIASGTFNKYSFLIEDTLYENNDSVFVISFKPKKGKNFDGLKGVLYISSNGYAINNVIAQPNEENDGTTIKIQQKYEFIDNKQWFPTQLNTDIVFGNVKINGFTTVGIGRTYIKDINLSPSLKKKDFKELGVVQLDDAAKKSEDFWNIYRNDSLTIKEKNTYAFMDSVGKKEKFDQKLKTIEVLLSNKIRYKFLDFDLDKFLNYNDYEGFRLGASFNTNQKFHPIISIGAFGALGTNDKMIKYGANLKINIMPKTKTYLQASFMQDVVETGGNNFYYKNQFFALSEDIRKILLERMDSVEKYELSFHTQFIPYSRVKIYLNQQYRQFTKGYWFLNNRVAFKQAVITEAGIQTYYAFGEKYLKFGSFELLEPTTYPVIFISYAQGFNNFLEGQLAYNRIDLKIEKSFTTKFIGRTNLQFASGYINGNLPYSLLYNGNGSNKRTLSISIPNTFETMRMNEFAANQYASFFVLHDFGRLLYRSERFEPRIAIKLNAGIGKLNNLQAHQNIVLKDFSKGFYEGGLLINSIFKSSFSSFGVGCFYRFGPYSYSNSLKNIAVKLSLGFSF